jgi:hypothetical protein
MGERKPINWNVDEDVADRFREFVQEKKGKKRGELGRMAERALIEYMDNDRLKRVEDGQDETHEKLDSVLALLSDADGSHTHMADVSPQTVGEKRDLIVGKLRERDAPVMPEQDVIEAIEDVAGGDDRTLAKYKDALRRSGEVYDHPDTESSAWTTDPERFASWALAVFESRPDADIREILEPYAMDSLEYEELLDDAAATARQNR